MVYSAGPTIDPTTHLNVLPLVNIKKATSERSNCKRVTTLPKSVAIVTYKDRKQTKQVIYLMVTMINQVITTAKRIFSKKKENRIFIWVAISVIL